MVAETSEIAVDEAGRGPAEAMALATATRHEQPLCLGRRGQCSRQILRCCLLSRRRRAEAELCWSCQLRSQMPSG